MSSESNPQRWKVLIAYSSFSFINQCAFVQYSTIMDATSEYYNVSASSIIWLCNCYFILYFLFANFAIKPLEMRLDLSIMLGSFLTASGYWLIYIGYRDYWFALAGYILISTGQLFLSAPPYISDKWFPAHERTMTTSIGIFVNAFGANLAIIYTVVVFNHLDNTVSAIHDMNCMYAILSTVSFALCVLFLEHEPEVAPSHSASIDKLSSMETMRLLFRYPRHIMELFSIAIFIGASWAYMIVIGVILAPHHFTQEQIGFVSVCYSTTGTIGGVVASYYLDHQIKSKILPHYDKFIKGFITVGFVALVLKCLVLHIADEMVIFFLSGCIGLGFNAFAPLALQGAIENLFPASEVFLFCLILQIANVFGLIISYLLVYPSLVQYGLYILAAILAPFYLFLLIAQNTNYLRHKQESKLERQMTELQ